MANHFVCDCNWYQVNNEFYPVEITILNIDTKYFGTFYIKYPANYLNNLTTKYQHDKHGLDWDAGNETLCSAIAKMKQVVYPGDVVYVKGDEKTKLVAVWLPKARVKEITNAPSYSKIEIKCEEKLVVYIVI